MTTVVLNTAANVDDSQFPALTNGAQAPVILQLGVDAAGQRVVLGANARAAGVAEVLYQPSNGATASNGVTIDITAMGSPMTLVGSGSGNHFQLTRAELAQTTINGGAAGGDNYIGFTDAVVVVDGDFSHGNLSHIANIQLMSGTTGQLITLGPSAVALGITGIYAENAIRTHMDFSGMAGTAGVTVRPANEVSIIGSPGNDTYRFFADDLTSGDTIRGSAGTTNKIELRDEAAVTDDMFTNVSNVSIVALTFDHSGQSVTLGAKAQAAGVRTVQFTAGSGLPLHGYLADVSQMSVGMTVRGTANNDTMLGGGGDDRFIIGANSSDSIIGGGGDDVAVFVNPRSAYSISSSGGIVTVFQNSHSIDTISGVERLQFSDQTITTADGGGGNTVGGGGNPGLASGLIGAAADDTLSAGAMGDVIIGGGGSDSISCGNFTTLVVAGTFGNTASGTENDTITAGSGNNTIWGGAGANQITVGDGNNLIAIHSPTLTSFGNSTLRLGNGGDTVFAVGGNDTIIGGSGINFIHGGAGNVSITAGSGLALIVAGEGASTIKGGAGINALFGVGGNDVLNGGTGGCTIVASGGAATGSGDTVHAGGGTDFVVLNAGVETVITDLGTGPVRIGLGGFTAANQQKSIQIGAGSNTLLLSDRTSFSGDGYTVTGYKPGQDHILVTGLSAHAMADLSITAGGGGAVISASGAGSITLVGLSPGQISAGDFSFG